LALTALTSGGRSVGIVRLRTTSHGVHIKKMAAILSKKNFTKSIHTYTSVSNAILFSIYSSSLLYLSAVPGHYHATVYLAQTFTLYFPLYLKWTSSKLIYVSVVPFVVIRSWKIFVWAHYSSLFSSCGVGVHTSLVLVPILMQMNSVRLLRVWCQL
jgi:hypothetical protein